jgi:hypothetical protein
LLDELAKAEYHEQRDLLTELLGWLVRELGSLRAPASLGHPWLMLLLVVAIAAAVAIVARIVGGPVARRPMRSRERGVLLDELRSAAELRVEAAALAGRGDWTGAILARFRALARALEERTVLTASPGRTAREIAIGAARRLPGLGDRLMWAAQLFDALAYADQSGDEAGYTAVTELDESVSRTVPVRPSTPAPLSAGAVP